MIAASRVPFEEAISEKALLKKRWGQISRTQQVALKAIYGIPLTDEREENAWAMLQEQALYDHLGYPLSCEKVAYSPKEYRVITLVWGRRGGKTDSVSSFALAYEAALGGHEQFIREGQTAKCFLMAQDMNLAKANLPLVESTLRTSPLLAKQIANVTATEVLLKNSLAISMVPANPRAVRGYAVPAIGMDEVGLWYTDSESANADVEVGRAIRFSMMQFPFRKMIITSTPWVKQGLLWIYYNAGTAGQKLPEVKQKGYSHHLLLHTSTAGSGNPLIKRADLQSEYDQDQEAFDRESLAHFSDAFSSFITRQALEKCVNIGVSELPPAGVGEERPFYVAAMDPAFRGDSFTFTIVHKDKSNRLIQDVAIRMTPESGTKLNPTLCLGQVATYCRLYGVHVVHTDQYQMESLQQLALDEGLSIEGTDFTGRSKPRIVGNLANLVNAQSLKILDPDFSAPAKEQFNELVILEKKMGSGGTVSVSAPKGKHDDMAMVLALACYKASWLSPAAAVEQKKPATVHDKCWSHLKKKWAAKKHLARQW